MLLKILVADDDPINAEILEAILNDLGHVVEVAQDGLDAVEKFQDYGPDIVIMDINMPGIDGIEATRRIRQLEQSCWIPIVFYSALDSADDIVMGIEAGGDDYLIKPIVPELIAAKISSYSRILDMQRTVRKQTAQLYTWREMAEEQSQLGQHVVSRLLDADGLRDPLLKWMNTPADSFSGDLVCAIRGPADILYVMLADAAGHGLSAALSSLPMTQVFYGMAGKGFPTHSIAEELNRKLKSFLPIDRFVAASLVTLDTRNQTIEVWNGGNPDILFLTGDGTVTMRWPSRHPPLGILPPELFNASTELVNYSQPGEICLCSDGIIEAEDPSGRRLNQHGFEKLLGAAPQGTRMEALQAGLTQHLDDNPNHDDLSCILVNVPIERRRDIRADDKAAKTIHTALFSDWRLDLGWGATELQTVDVVPAVLAFSGNIPALNPHRGNLYLILSELFNNALDHGVLGLDSRLKQSDDGFEHYLNERERRMSEMIDGRIDMSFHLYHHDDQPVLDIRVTDSGNGFDHETMWHLLDTDPNAHQAFGRGIMLVRKMCRNMSYSGRGNSVTVQYELK